MPRDNTSARRAKKTEGTKDDWTPLGNGNALDNPDFRSAAKAHAERDTFNRRMGTTQNSFNVGYKTDAFGQKSYGTAEVNERGFRKRISDANERDKKKKRK